MLDLLITNGIIIDGTGKPPFSGCVGVKSGKIVCVTGDESALSTIDAKGRIICPGFIDAHSHGDLRIGKDYTRLSKTSQGITSELVGQCGQSIAPTNPRTLPLLKNMFPIATSDYPNDMVNWSSYKRFLDYCSSVPKKTNVKFLVGHSALRIAVMGFEKRVCTYEELEKMKDLLREAMECGAGGLSSGLIYPPGCYADTNELVELAKVAASYGGIYASHIRNESNMVIEAVQEAIEIGRRANIPVCISHHKVMGYQNHKLQKETLRLINEATKLGVCVTCDQYPYLWNQTSLSSVIPPWYFNNGTEALVELLKSNATRSKIKSEIEDENTQYENFFLNSGGWKGILVTMASSTPEVEGRTIAEHATILGMDPWDVFFDTLIINNGKCLAAFHTLNQQNLFDVILNENTVVGTDGLTYAIDERSHPRAYGTMPRAINYYVRENKLLSLEKMIHKMTGLPACRLGFKSKGFIRCGYDADILIIDWDSFFDNATFSNPCALTDGLDYVIVNGEVVWHEKRFSGLTPGKIILHNTPSTLCS